MHAALAAQERKYFFFEFGGRLLQAEHVDAFFDEEPDVLKDQAFVAAVQNIVCRAREGHAKFVQRLYQTRGLSACRRLCDKVFPEGEVAERSNAAHC